MIFLTLFQSTGFWAVHEWQLASVRSEMKQRIKAGVPEEDLILLKIPKSLEENPGKEFKRIHEREFRYKGEMYDIIRKVDHNDETWYTCIHDVKESGLFKKLDEFTDDFFSNNPDEKQRRNLALDFFQKNYLPQLFAWAISKPVTVISIFGFRELLGIELADRLLRPPNQILPHILV